MNGLQPVRQTFRYQNARSWVRRMAYNYPGVMFTAELPDRFLDCWRDHEGKQHFRTRRRGFPPGIPVEREEAQHDDFSN